MMRREIPSFLFGRLTLLLFVGMILLRQPFFPFFAFFLLSTFIISGAKDVSNPPDISEAILSASDLTNTTAS
jgi:hypothetical protein